MESGRRSPSPELEAALLGEVDRLSSSIEAAKRIGDVVCALHAFAVRLFPIDATALAGVLDEQYKSKVLDVSRPTESQREIWKSTFYRGAAFPAAARVLIYNVGFDWLACFPHTARVLVYDQLFTSGPATEIIQVLVPCLASDGPSEVDNCNVVCSNVERLLVLCLLENQGVYSIAREFIEGYSSQRYAYGVSEVDKLSSASRMAQVLSSIPDKSRLASPVLSAHSFFKQVTSQLLDVAEDRSIELFCGSDILQISTADGIFFFIGETFSRICRRGSADTLLTMLIPRLLDYVHICMPESSHSSSLCGFKSNPKSVFWSNLIGHLKDSYAVEKMSEGLLHHLASGQVDDEEAYWILWVLYHKNLQCQTATRVMFSEKFLLCKVFPFCCLKWILHLSVFEYSPDTIILKNQNTRAFFSTTQHLLDMWSKREFIQSAPIEKQAYITAAIGLCLERMTKEEIETTQNVMNSILQGVSCRLESPMDIIRKMASSIALAFSKVVDPNNPLYLDGTETETIDWEFGLISSKKGTKGKAIAWDGKQKYSSDSQSPTEIIGSLDEQMTIKDSNKLKESKISGAKPLDPDEIIDPALVIEDFHSGSYDSESDDSVVSSEPSLQPYDMTDDDADLRKKISQISDLFTALRKSDDPDGVEQALNIAEKLIRAAPDELQHNAGDLVKTLVYIRCSELTVEGEEDSAEERRQKALISLLVTCPFESVDVLTGLLYSSNLDVSQRILIIDVMTEAAQELCNAKTLRINHQKANLISSTSDQNSWYLPTNIGLEGPGPWEEILESDSLLSWPRRFQRTLPSRPGQVKVGKSCQWSLPAVKTHDKRLEWSKNRFPLYAAAFMLPAMRGFDKRKHGVDFLGRDFIVLGKLIHMLGVCMRCVAMHPEASVLAPPLLDMLSSRSVSHHSEAYVRRAVLFAVSCILLALHPSFIASALIGGQEEISKGLDWIRTWAMHVAEIDPDNECTRMAITCLQLHAEMALQTSRSLESADCFKSGISKTSPVKKDIILPVARITNL